MSCGLYEDMRESGSSGGERVIEDGATSSLHGNYEQQMNYIQTTHCIHCKSSSRNVKHEPTKSGRIPNYSLEHLYNRRKAFDIHSKGKFGFLNLIYSVDIYLSF